MNLDLKMNLDLRLKKHQRTFILTHRRLNCILQLQIMCDSRTLMLIENVDILYHKRVRHSVSGSYSLYIYHFLLSDLYFVTL